MWSGKMATRWRRKDGHLNPGKGHFLSSNNPDEFELNTDVEMDTHSAVDHSILAIFEDSSALSEDKAGAEEDSDKLLSALTEMLESVEDDDDTLSPFNTLPETSLLKPQDTTKKINTSDPHEQQQMSWNNVMKQAGALSQPENNKVDTDVEVFASASLVNLVRIMHSYCLKLQVEEEPGKSIKNSVLFSNEEVWKYERPSEDIDEEINVVSDDDEAVGAEMKDCDNGCKPLKSALLNGSPSKKEKKRVSFGAVRVTSFDLDSQTRDIASSAANHCPDALANDTALESTISSENDIMTDTPQKHEGKRKPISLQQYRQLRQKRQPLVEKQGNYTTKWPSVTVPPKELTPILGVTGQKTTSVKPVITQNSVEGTKTSPDVQPLKTKASSDLPHKAKRPRIQPVASLPNLPLPACKKSPTKKPTILSSDPPNPVLLPLPVQHTTPNEHALHQNEKTHHNQQLVEDKSITKSISAPKCNNQSPTPAEQHQHVPNTLDVVPVNSPLLPYEPPTPVTTPVKEMTPEAFKISLPSPCLPPSSGIEASDLTSLLEQFEETQAKEEGESVRAPQIHSKLLSELDRASPNSILWTSPVSSPDLALPMPHMETLLSTSALAPLDDGPNVKIPEPLGTEVILSSTQDQPVRPKGPPVKAIQIIDPRPLPFKRTHTSQLESSYTPAHVYLAISADHDYCTVTSETIEIKQTNPSAPFAGPKPTSMVDTLENSSNMNATQEEGTKLPMVHPTLLPDSAKKQNSDIRLDAYMIPPTPPPSPPLRGGDRISPPRRGRDSDRRRYFRRSCSSASSSSSSSCSSSSSSSSRSGSRSPKRQRRHRHNSESSSCSSSPSCSGSPSPPRRHQERYSRPRFSRSRSSSWSQSRSRSRSLSPRWRIARRQCTDVGSRESRKLRREQEIRAQKLRAIDERRVVYVGRIRRTMTHEELRERFTQFGDVESVSLHFRDRGDHYGFVTFYNTDDAFAAIDNGEKIRKNDELPFDICFGGRRQFCNSHYADLDANRDAEPSPARSRFGDVDFDLLLKQAQKGLKR